MTEPLRLVIFDVDGTLWLKMNATGIASRLTKHLRLLA